MAQGDPTPDPTEPPPPAPSPPRPKASKCPCCGHFTLRPTAKAHRVYRYRQVVLTLPAWLLVPTCSCCKHSILSLDSVPELATALEAAYRAELVHRASVEITYLGRYYSQRCLERELALLRADPHRLEELRAYWALPPSEPAPRKRKQGA